MSINMRSDLEFNRARIRELSQKIKDEENNKIAFAALGVISPIGAVLAALQGNRSAAVMFGCTSLSSLFAYEESLNTQMKLRKERESLEKKIQNTYGQDSVPLSCPVPRDSSYFRWRSISRIDNINLTPWFYSFFVSSPTSRRNVGENAPVGTGERTNLIIQPDSLNRGGNAPARTEERANSRTQSDSLNRGGNAPARTGERTNSRTQPDSLNIGRNAPVGTGQRTDVIKQSVSLGEIRRGIREEGNSFNEERPEDEYSRRRNQTSASDGQLHATVGSRR